MIKTYEEIKRGIESKLSAFRELSDDYITPEGKFAKKAYETISWYMCFVAGFTDKEKKANLCEMLKHDLDNEVCKCEHMNENVKALLYKFVKAHS